MRAALGEAAVPGAVRGRLKWWAAAAGQGLEAAAQGQLGRLPRARGRGTPAARGHLSALQPSAQPTEARRSEPRAPSRCAAEEGDGPRANELHARGPRRLPRGGGGLDLFVLGELSLQALQFHADGLRLLTEGLQRGEVTAEVVSAKALTEKQTHALVDGLKRAVGAAVSLESRIDPGLLGGLVVKLGSRMVDSSLRTKLQRLRLAMKGVG